MTFEPHPLEVVNPQAAPPLLTTGPERREILAQTPLDYVFFLRFDRRLAALTPEQFVRDVLLARCDMRELVIGHDHGFGRGRSGDVETLRRLGESLEFEVDVVADGGRRRAARLQHPDPPRRGRRRSRHRGADARPALLGERVVGEGERRGRLLGVPTHQPGRGARRRSCCRRTGCTRCGSSGEAAVRAG